MDIVQPMLSLVNNERAKNGLQPLYIDNILIQCAKQQSDYNASIRQLTHNNPKGNLGQRASNLGANYSGWGENIAYGYSTVQAVFTGWMNSSGHRANILKPTFNRFGCYFTKASNGTYYWCQCFGRV